MRLTPVVIAIAALPALPGLAQSTTPQSLEPISVMIGEQLPPENLAPGVVESMDVALARQAAGGFDPGFGKFAGNAPGRWVVPSFNATTITHSGEHYVTNKGGDPSMGIGFGRRVDVHEAFVHGQGGAGIWADAVRAIGYRNGVEVSATDWFGPITATPQKFAIGLVDVDRIVIEAEPRHGALAWYGLDNFAFTPHARKGEPNPGRVVLDFDNTDYDQQLTDSGFAGLTWEVGAGAFIGDPDVVPAPQAPLEDFGPPTRDEALAGGGGVGAATEAVLISDFQATIRGSAGSFSTPPDHELAVGPTHIVVVVNRAFEVYEKTTGTLAASMTLGAFLPGSSGDPRAVYDQHSGRFIVLVTDFNQRLYLAVSTTSNPTGSWYKTNIDISEGIDANAWPDHPTLGVDADGIYSAAYMVEGGTNARMSIFAIEKAPLIDANPSLGVVTAFRNQSFEGAIQPCHTYGDAPGQYFVSRFGSNNVRLRRLDGPLTNPTLALLPNIPVSNFSQPPDLNALGTSTPLDSVDTRIVNAVYRDGDIWATHSIGVNGRPAIRWYKINTTFQNISETGTITDPENGFLFPTIATDAQGNAFIGASMAGPNMYPSAVMMTRAYTDPPNVFTAPQILRAGNGTYNLVDGFGRNRWGDYSMTTLDPDEITVWTLQEYVHANNTWGTHVGGYQMFPPPANNLCLFGSLIFAGSEPFSTFASTSETSGTTPCGDVESDIWYRFAATQPGDLVVSLDNVDFDATIALYGAACPNETSTPITCDAVVDGSVSVSIPVTQPGLFRVRIGSASGSQGTGTISIGLAAPIPCIGDCTPVNMDGTVGNNVVNIDDLLAVIGAFGETSGPCDTAPANPDGTFGNGLINVDDILTVINSFGPCP
ncbi:MAG: hypothetical protein AAF432_14605 [Planctomycetota bacterium]